MKTKNILFGSVLSLLILFTFSSYLPSKAQVDKGAGRIVSLAGSVSVKRGTQTLQGKPFQNLEAGDIVVTGANSRAAILLRDESLIKLNSNSQITIKNVISPIKKVISGPQEKTQIKQDTGEIWIRTKDRPGTLEIDTKSGSAAIRGTELHVYASDEKTLLTVTNGSVELTNQLGSVLIAQNEQGEATPTRAPTKRALTVEETENTVQWIFYFPENLKLKEEVLDTSLEVLTKKYEENPNNAEAATLLGVKKLVSGNYQEAYELFEKSKGLDPNSATNELMRARAQFVLHNQKEALETIDNAIKLDSNWAILYSEKSKYLAAQGDLVQAEKQANKAVSLDANSPESWIGLGEVQYAFGRVNKALDSFNKALNTDSGLAEAHIGKGKALISSFHNEEAIDEFLSAVLLEPKLSRAHLYLGQAYYQNKDTQKAINEIQEAINIDPNDPLTLNSLSIIYDVAHRYGDALELDQRTIEITPNLLESGARQSRNLSVASGNIGIEPLRFGLTDWSFFQANKALRENPIDGAGHFTVGTIYNSNRVEPLLPTSEGQGAAQAQLSTGQIRGLRGTNLTGVNARTSTNEYDLGFNFASDSERLIGKLLTPSILGSPNGRYRFFRAPELYVTTNGIFGQQQVSLLREGGVSANGYLGTPWNIYLNTEFMGGLVRNVFGDITGKGNRSFFKGEFALSPLKTVDVIGSYTRADVNARLFNSVLPSSRFLFTPDLNDFDVTVNWHPSPNNVFLNRFFGEIASTRLDATTPGIGGEDIFAGIFPRNYGYQFRHLLNSNRHRFTSGAEWIHSQNPFQVNLDFSIPVGDTSVRSNSYIKGRTRYDIFSAYFQDLFRVTKKTDFVFGLRYNHIFNRTKDNTIIQTITDGMSSSIESFDRRSTDRVSFSPQTGIVYNIGQNTTIRLASQHKSFYNTFLPELAPQDVAGVPFSDQSEFFSRGTEGWDHSASFEHKLPQILPWLDNFVKIKPFYRRMMVRDYDSILDHQLQRIRNWGFEIGYNQLMFKQVGFFFSYIYQHIRNRTPYGVFDDLTLAFALANGKIPILQVPNRIRFGWTWHSPTGFSLNFIHTYVGPKFGDLENRAKIRGYFLGDLNLSYESPRTRSYALTFGVNNLYGAAFRQSLRQRDPGVTFYGNAEIRGVIPVSWHFWKK